MRILSDVAPYSREYQKFSQIVRRKAQDDPDLKAEYERIAEQVRQTKESTLQVAQKHFNAPTDRIEGTISKASAKVIELAEYPGRIFHFSSVGTSMADLTAEMLGSSNKMTRAEAVRKADKSLKDILITPGPFPPRTQYNFARAGEGPALRHSSALYSQTGPFTLHRGLQGIKHSTHTQAVPCRLHSDHTCAPSI